MPGPSYTGPHTDHPGYPGYTPALTLPGMLHGEHAGTLDHGTGWTCESWVLVDGYLRCVWTGVSGRVSARTGVDGCFKVRGYNRLNSATLWQNCSKLTILGPILGPILDPYLAKCPITPIPPKHRKPLNYQFSIIRLKEAISWKKY